MNSKPHDKPHSELFGKLSQELLADGKAFRFQARGFSMSPTVCDGDSLVVEPVNPEFLTVGEVVLFRQGTALRAHRLVEVDHEHDIFLTRGDNSPSLDPPIRKEQILGRVSNQFSGGNHSRFQKMQSFVRRFGRFGWELPFRHLLASSQWFVPLLLVLAAIAMPQAAYAQVSVGASTSAAARITRFNRTITTAAIIPTGVNRLLLVGVSIDVNNHTTETVTSVNFGPSGLTLLGSHNDTANDHRVEVWYLLNPASINNTVQVNFSSPGNGATVGAVVGVVAFNGVDQTTPLGSFFSADGGSSGFSSLDVDSGTGQMIMDVLAIDGSQTATVNTSQTLEWTQNSGTTNNTDVRGTGSVRTGAPSVPMSETFSGNSEWSQGAVSINPYQADLSVSVSGNSVSYPGNITYTLAVTNNGPSTATGVILTDTLPAGLTFVSATPTQGTCGLPNVTCTLGTISSGSTVTVSVVATPGAAGGYPNTASVTGTINDLDNANNSSMGIAYAQLGVCSVPTTTNGGTLTGIIDTYYPGTATATAGSTSITLGTATGNTTPISSGDLVLIIQMQDAAINSSNNSAYGDGATGSGWTSLNDAGVYEFATATNGVPLTGGTLNLAGGGPSGGLLFTYTSAAATGTQGQRTFQVIRVPHYATATLGTGLTASAWNGSTGGVFALDTSGALNLNNKTISVDGLGFRGGAGLELNGGIAGSTTNDFRQIAPATYPAGPNFSGVPVNGIDGPKGEGFAGTPRWVQVSNTPFSTGVEGYPNGSMGRGAPGNGGGGGTDANNANDENAGGGGGGNGGSGGFGGDAWNSNLSVGGLGGAPYPAGAVRVVLGGGGGAGSRNNSDNNTTGAPTRIAQASSGSAGGGIIIIRAGSITGTGTVSANGADAYNLTSNDAGGGGGAGGSIVVLSSAGSVGTLTVSAHGGRGGDAWDDDPATGAPLADRHGPGGGGGGGVVLLSGTASGTPNVSGGSHGTTLPSPGQYQYGATDGSAGTVSTSINYAASPGPHTVSQCTDVSITKTAPATAPLNGTFSYSITVTNNGTLTATNVQLTDTLPAGVTFSSAAPAANCSQASGTVTCTFASLAAGNSTSITINVIASSVGTVTNTANVSETESDYNIINNTASATTTIVSSADLSIAKTGPSSVAQGATFSYTLAVHAGGPLNSTGITVTDTLPLGVTYVSVTTSAGSCSQSGGIVTCNITSLSNGSNATITITVTAGSPAIVTNTAVAAGNEPDPNIANNTSSVTTTITYPSSVKLESFNALSVPAGVLLVWRTGAEQHNLGFNVYREENGQRVRLNPALIAGSALIFRRSLARHGGKRYAWVDHNPASAGGWYWLEDVDLDGTRTLHGPVAAQVSSSVQRSVVAQFPVLGAIPVRRNSRLSSYASTMQSGNVPSSETMAEVNSADASEAIPATSHVLQTSFTGGKQTATAQQVQYSLASKPAIKILVRQEGWYRVTQPELIAAGLSPYTDPRTLKLYAEGVEQPIAVTGARNGFGGFSSQSAIEFYGTGIDTPYSDTRVYWLVSGNDSGLRIPQSITFGSGGSRPQEFEQTIELRERTTYFSSLLRAYADNFFGAAVTTTPTDQVLTVSDLANPATEDAKLHVVLQGVTFGVSHDVQISLNGSVIGDLQFDGQNEGSTDLNVPFSQLHDGDNTITLTAQNGETDISLVNYIDLTYPHTYTAESDTLKFTAASGDSLQVGGFTQAPSYLVDITNPASPMLVFMQTRRQGSGYTLTAQVPWSPSGKHTLLALADDQISAPAQVVANHPSDWHSRQAGAQEVMISPSAFVSALMPLANLRERQGKSAVVVPVEDLYDEFNYGERSPYAIRDFLQNSMSAWRQKPAYLLLAGDASIDPRNYLGLGFFDFVPTALVPTAEMMTASDDWFSDFNNTGFAQMETGRIPARTEAGLQTVVSKIVNYESNSDSGNWTKQAVLVADPNDDSANFTEQAQTIQGLLPSTMNTTDIFLGNLDPTAAQQALLNSLNSGALFVNFNGHGSVEVWSSDNLLDDSVAGSLTNGSHLPVFFIMNCLNGYFQDVYTESLAEALLFSQNGGAVAVWASSGLTSAEPQFQMEQSAVRTLFSSPGMTLGDAIQVAKQGIADPDVRRTFLLFGDPLTRLKGTNSTPSSLFYRRGRFRQ